MDIMQSNEKRKKKIMERLWKKFWTILSANNMWNEIIWRGKGGRKILPRNNSYTFSKVREKITPHILKAQQTL